MNSEIMHPTTELLTDYIESSTASEFSDVRTHLINCKECRFEANRLAQFKANLINEIPHFRNAQYDTDLGLQQIYQDADIEAYVDGALTDADEQKISALLQNDKSALKSALPEQFGHVYYEQEELGLTVGVWTTTSMQEAFGPYPGDEFMSILEGQVSMIDAHGDETLVKAGEVFCIRNAIPISWKQVGFLRKFYMTYADPRKAA